MPIDQSVLKQQAAEQLMSLLGLGTASGIGFRSMLGLRDMLHGQPSIPVAPNNQLPQVLKIPNAKPAEEEAAQAVVPMRKAAAGLDGLLSHLRNPSQLAAQASQATQAATQAATKWIASVLPNIDTQKPLGTEWGIPLGTAVAGGGASAGYHLLDWLLGKQKAQQNDAEVDSAYKDYEAALQDRYTTAMQAKRAGDDRGVTALAEAYLAAPEPEGTTKQAAVMSLLGWLVPGIDSAYSTVYGHDRWQAIKGGVNTAALAAMLGSGKLTYDWARGQNKEELLQQALKLREMQRSRMSPPPLLALQQQEDDPHGPSRSANALAS